MRLGRSSSPISPPPDRGHFSLLYVLDFLLEPLLLSTALEITYYVVHLAATPATPATPSLGGPRGPGG